MINVRPLLGRDCLDVLRINARSRPAVAALDEAEFSRLLALPNCHLAAESNGTLVGYALAFDRDASYDGEEFLALRLALAEQYIYIDQVAVLNESRGMGVGSSLYNTFETIAHPKRARLLCCEVNTAPPNAASMAFHKKMGFRPIGSLATLDGREVELLAKNLR